MHSEETSIYYIIWIIVGVLGSLIASYIYSIIKANRVDIERRKQFMINELKIIEKERERIAQDIHDSAGPNLSVLKMNLEMLAVKEPKILSDINAVLTHLDSIISELRKFSHDLMPLTLRRKGIISAIKELASRHSRTSISIQVETSNDFEVDLDLGIQIYRIVEEFIFNSLKYAQASKILIRFTYTQNALEVILKDDGKGFDYKKIKNELNSLGLKGFEYRTEVLGGLFSYYSEPNKGVELHILFPR